MNTSKYPLLTKADLAREFSRSEEAIAIAARRKNASIIPMPFKVGRRLYWTRESVDAWIAEQVAANTFQPAPAPEAPKRGPGRPRKGENRQQAQQA